MMDGDGNGLSDAAPPRLPTTALSGLPLALVLTNPAFEDNPIVYANPAFAKLTGHPLESVIGRNCRFLQGPATEPDRVERIRAALARGEDIAIEITNHRADGTPFLNRLTITSFRDEGEDAVSFYLGTQSAGDIEVAESRLEAVQMQLAEVQHRVKNHLAMIVSMIRMQARGSSAAEDYTVIARRIEALQLLYQELSDTGVSSTFRDEVPLGAYVSRIAAAIGHLDGGQGIRVNVIAEEVIVDATTAGRVGLLVSEILTNAFRHAFDGRETGLVETRVQRLSEGVIRIQITDDGVGLPEGTDWPTRGNLGAKIVTALLAGLEARHAVTTSAAGTTVSIDIPGRARPNPAQDRPA
jgi:PAS domain S-box-containing protein